MRIGMISPYSLTVPGGVQGQVLGLAKALRKQARDVRVLGPCDGPPPDTSVTPLGNSLPTAANGSIAPIAPDPAAQRRTFQALREERFDVLHLHEPLVPGPTVTALLLKGSPLVGTFHAAGSSAGYRWLAPVLKKMAARIDVRCAVSPAAQRMAQKALGGSYEVLFNAIDTEPAQAPEPWPTEAPTIFFLARHERRKGLAVLLEAMQYLPQDLQVWIGGEGPDTEKLLKAYSHDHRLVWLGRLSADEKAARLRGADIFCVPSLGGESFGVVLLEAMLAGTAIVASDLPAYQEVSHHQREALLAPSGDARLLAQALNEALAQPGLREQLTSQGRVRVEQFSMARLAKRYGEIYDSI